MKLHLPKTRRYRIYIYLLCSFLILFATDLLWVRLWRHIHLGYDTTRITTPLRPDGTPDYPQALDNIASAGITPENNAVPLLISAVGPFPEDWPAAPSTYARLHMNPPAQQGDYAINYFNYVRRKNPTLQYDDEATWKEEYFSYTHLWTAAEHPELTAWIHANHQPLELLDAASQRPRYYLPGSHLYDARLTGRSIPDFIFSFIFKTQSLARTAIARALLEAGSGDFQAARADLMMVHRFARLIQQDQSFIFFSFNIEAQACRADRAIALSEKLSSTLAIQFLKDLEALSPLSGVVDQIDQATRYESLEALIDAAHHGLHLTEEERGIIFDPTTPFGQIFDPATPLGQTIDKWLTPNIPVHFNAALRQVNQAFDDYVAALRAPTYIQRKNLVEACERKDHTAPTLAFNGFFQPVELRLTSLLPNFGRGDPIYTATLTELNLTRLAFALAAYHADHATYPDSLAQLAPTYLSSIPSDLFIDAPLHYTRTPVGYLLYSVGMDMKDAGGHDRDNPDPKFPNANPDNIVARVGPYPATQPAAK